MPRPKGKRRSSRSPSSDSDDSDQSVRYPKNPRRGADAEPRPGTSAQALREMRKEHADFQKQKRPLPDADTDKSGSKRTRRSDSSNTSTKPKSAPKPCKDYIKDATEALLQHEQSSGIIKKISLYNFMCHSSFHKEWHPNLNFVTGENGSGKSALLSGILIGLGARALITSRTKSISHLIQNGKDHAKTEITLLNFGGISEEKYGKEFMIERIISTKGASTYKIKCHGKFRTLPRTELDFILLNLDIQLDNPLMILNQETARSFLRSKDPKAKYKLFFDGTMFSTILAILLECQENVDISSCNLNNYEKATQCVAQRCESLKESFKKVQEVEHIKDTVQKIWAEYLWSLVIQIEKKKEDQELRLQAAASEVNTYEVKLQKALAKKTEILENPSEKEEELAAKSSLKVKETSLSQIRTTHVKVRSQISEAKMKLRGCSVEQRRERMEECQGTIEELKKKARENEEKMQAEFAIKKDKLDSEKAAVLQQVNTLKQDADQFRSGADAIRQQVHELKDQANALNIQIQRTQNNLENLKKSTSNKFSVYGKDMEELIAKLNANESKFKKKPVGPIGAYCTIKSPKWLNLVEHIMSHTTTTFVVDNDSDSKVFKSLMNSVYGKYENGRGRVKQPTIFVSKFTSRAFDISGGEARVPGIPTVLDLIEIEGNNHIVFNALCDSVKAEKILLFENKMAAINLIGNENRCPRTCIAGYSLDFYQVTPHPYYAVWAQHNPKFQAMYLKTSTKQQISSMITMLKDLKSEMNEIKPALEAKSREEAQLREEQNERQAALTQARNKSYNLDHQIQQLNQKRNYQPDLTSQMEELNELTKEYHEHVAIKEAAQKCLEENKSKLEEISSEKAKLQAEINELTKLISSFAEKADTRQSKLQNIENGIVRLTNVINKYKKEQESYQKNLETIEKDLERKLQPAAEESSRVETNREPGEVENEFKTMKKMIKESTKILGSKEEIEHKLTESKKELNTRRAILKVYRRLLYLVSGLLATQRQTFERTKATSGDTLSSYFQAMANERGYQGSCLVDHESKELYYFVCPDGDSHAKTQKLLQTQDAKLMRKQLVEYSLGLSGGERSFATICFIISMWQVMDCPFFMLDEFDVFMDPFNRKSSQNALVSHAKRQKGHQFFFFTPLELTQIPTSADACVLRMFPPVRNQDTDDDGEDRNVPPSPSESVGEVENTDPSNGTRSTRTNAKKPRSAAGPNAMREKTNSRR